MGVSRDALIPRVRDLLGDTPYTTTSTTTGVGSTVTVPDGTRWAEGDIGEWQTGTVGYEQFLVTGDPVGNDLPVSRAYGNTVAETHTSGDRIAQNPAFFGRQIQQALEAGVRSLYPFVYKATPIILSVVGGGADPDWWDVAPANAQAVLGLIDVNQVYGQSPALQVARYGRDSGTSISFDTTLPTDLVTSGVGLRINSGLYHPTNDLFITVAQAVTGSGADTDIEDSGSFPVADYLISFAAGRLTGASEIPRVSSGADLETSGTVSAGARQEVGRTFAFDAKKQLEVLAIRYRRFYRPLLLTGLS